MTHSRLLAALAAIGGLLLSGASAPPPASLPAPPKSLVVISLDTARADHLHCYGYPLPTSPAIDRLAAEGILFETAFTQAVNTGPAHASLLTGLTPMAHGVRFNGSPLGQDFATLATLLAAAGYRTGAFVSGYTMMTTQTGFDRGFEVYDDKFTGQERRAEQTIDLALAWLKSLPPDKPFFVFLHLFDPHGKYDPPAGFADKFRKGSYEPIVSADPIPDYQRLNFPGGGISLDPLDYISRYDGEIAYADSQIARLLALVGDKPVVAFTSDHGETLAERDYYFSHGARLTDEALRIPLIIRPPERALKGKRIRGTAQIVDVMPTVLAILGQPAPGRLAGRNLLPFVRAGAIPPGAIVISEARATPQSATGRRLTFPPRSIVISARDERVKLLAFPTAGGASYELFDLATDSGEKKGVAGSEAARLSPVFQALDLYRVSGRPPEPPDLDEETKKKLRSLGYVN